MWTWIVFTKYSEETSSNRRKRRKDTRDILIKKDRLKQRYILVLREQWESSLDFSYHHNMSRAVSTLCLLIFTGNADMSRILLERTGILLAYIYICISKSYVWFLFGNPVQNATCLLAAQAYWKPQGIGQILLLRGFVLWRQRQSFTKEEGWCKAVSCT